jgi:hypothetical protein
VPAVLVLTLVAQADLAFVACEALAVLFLVGGDGCARVFALDLSSTVLSFLWVGFRGAPTIAGAISLFHTHILPVYYTFITLLRYNLARKER